MPCMPREEARIAVIMTGDEESAGAPLEAARKDLVALAQRATDIHCTSWL